jgi:hypothetical protein
MEVRRQSGTERKRNYVKMMNSKSEVAAGKWRELKVIIWLRRTRKNMFSDEV